ncbi:hypothetical protein PFISCL1PPCAC_29138, partial [Pristionchus fissidentatus]
TTIDRQLATAMDVNTLTLTLESLPMENTFQIFSYLGIKDRKKIRLCSKTMRDVSGECDLFATEVVFKFGQDRDDNREVLFMMKHEDKRFPELLCAIKDNTFIDGLKRICSSIRVDRLHIRTEGQPVDDEILEKIATQFDFWKLHLEFTSRVELSVLRFAREHERRVDDVRIINCAEIPIPELPRSNIIYVGTGKEVYTADSALSDEQLVQICQQKHVKIYVVGNFTSSETFYKIVKILHASVDMEQIVITLDDPGFHRFLAAIKLRQDGLQILDDSNPSSPQVALEIGNRVLIDYHAGFLEMDTFLSTYGIMHYVSLVKGRIPEDNVHPVYCMTFPI